jgi:hypothetical protein
MGDTQGTETQQVEQKPAEGQTEKTFTQADVDRIVQDRVARTKASFADYDELKTFKESSKTEQQRAIDAAKAEGANEVTGKFTTRIVNAEIKATAAALDFADPKDAIALFGDISDVKIGDDGPDAEAIKTRLADIAKNKPYLLKASAVPPVRQRPKPPSGSDSTDTKPAGKSRAAAALREFRR